MFLVNSRYRHFSATSVCSPREVGHIYEVHLLPRLRCDFAEFLNQGSLKRLGILFLPTCVGLRYDHLTISIEDFLGSMGSITLCTYVLVVTSRPNKETDLPISLAYLLEPGCPTPG